MESLSHLSRDAPPARPSRPVLTHLFAFRAVAIVVILAGHCVRLFDWDGLTRVMFFLLDLLENGTVLFVFIAGYLFEYLAGRFSYRSYLRGKLHDVILPYLLVSVPALIYDVLLHDKSQIYPQLVDQGWFYKVGWFLLQGGAGLNFPLWFIPMIGLYYLASPAFMVLVRHPRLYAVLPLLVVLSALIHRPAHDNLATLHQAAYFLSAYVAGMWASHSRARLEPMLQKHWLPLTLGLGAMIIAQWRWSPFHGNYQGRAPFSVEHGLIDWTVLQKLLMCFVLLGFTARWYTRRVRGVDLLAELSFPIFFLHAYFIFLFQSALGPPQPDGSLMLYAAGAGSILLASTLLALSLKSALGRNSRWVIGA